MVCVTFSKISLQPEESLVSDNLQSLLVPYPAATEEAYVGSNAEVYVDCVTYIDTYV